MIVEPIERFEAHLESRVRRYRGTAPVSDMLLYHFGYGEDRRSARRGKRLRPQIAMRTALAEGAPLEHVLDAAAALEILHNYSLVHDDIEDRDELRHGRPTLWALHGIAQAINAGDAMCAVSFLTLMHAREHLPGDRVLEMVRVVHEAHRVMCEGQASDLQFEDATHVDLDAYHRMIAGKTGALFEASFVLGALAAGAAPPALERYAELGRAYGRAFQIRDDVLGMWASSDATGKVTGNDLARRKWSFPVVWALAQPASAARSVVAEAYALRRTLEPEEVTQVASALVTLGAREAAVRAVAEPIAVVERHPNVALREYLLGTLA